MKTRAFDSYYCGRKYDAVIVSLGLHDAAFGKAITAAELDQIQTNLQCFERQFTRVVLRTPFHSKIPKEDALLSRTMQAISAHPYFGKRKLDVFELSRSWPMVDEHHISRYRAFRGI
jgi:hypothetical protein